MCRKTSGLASIFVFLSLLHVSPASAEPAARKVIDRIVAVVGADDIITLVELKQRAKPLQKQLTTLTDAQRPIAEAQMYKELVNKLIDERIVAWWAREHLVKVTPGEVDMALDAVAKQNSMTRSELLVAAETQGLDQSAYRAELERQLLWAKVAQLVVMPRVRKEHGTEPPELMSQAIDKAMRVWIDERRGEVFVEVRL